MNNELGEKASAMTADKIKVVKDFLLKWTEPKPQYSGITASEMSLNILAELAKIESKYLNY